MKIVYYLILLVSNVTLFGQTRVIYHEYRPTDSWETPIVRWNISKDSLPRWYIKEKIDDKNRVLELIFYSGNNVNDNKLCMFIPWIKFNYPNDTTIVQKFFDNDGKIINDREDCLIAPEVVYHLSVDKKKILRTKIFKYDKNGLKQAIVDPEQHDAGYISFYEFSLSKMNNRFPITDNFNIDEFHFNDLEKQEIERLLKRKK